jgi:hypothetical protein
VRLIPAPSIVLELQNCGSTSKNKNGSQIVDIQKVDFVKQMTRIDQIQDGNFYTLESAVLCK